MKSLIVLLLFAMLLVAGCSQSRPQEKPKEEAKPQENKGTPAPAPSPVELPKEEPKPEHTVKINEDLFKDDLDKALVDLDSIADLNLSEEFLRTD